MLCSAVQFEILNVNDSVEDSASFITNEHAAFDSPVRMPPLILKTENSILGTMV